MRRSVGGVNNTSQNPMLNSRYGLPQPTAREAGPEIRPYAPIVRKTGLGHQHDRADGLAALQVAVGLLGVVEAVALADRDGDGPAAIALSSSPARQENSSGVRVWWASVGRVRNSEPAALSRCGSNGGTGPLDAPNSASVPRIAQLARLASNVAAPTPSYTAATPPSVRSLILAPNSSGSSG